MSASYEPIEDGALATPDLFNNLFDAAWKGDAFNVRRFGAVGDGVTDDVDAINDAIQAASDAGGGIVFMPPGTYLVSSAVILPNTPDWDDTRQPLRLRGSGRDCTKIKLAAGASDDVIQTDTFDALFTARSTAGSWATFLEDFTVDGNATNAPSGRYGIALYGWFVGIDRVDIISSVEDGLYTAWAEGERAGLGLDTAMSGMFTNIRIHDCGGIGWQMAGPHDSFAQGIAIIHNDNDYALRVVSGGDGFKCQWLDIWGGAGHGARLDVAASLIQPQISTTLAKIGVDIYAGYVQITDGIIAGNDVNVVLRGQNNRVTGRIETANTGIQFAELTNGNVVDVNTMACTTAFAFTSDGGTNHVRAGVRTSTVSDVILTGTPVGSTVLDIEAQGLGEAGPYQQSRRVAIVDTALTSGNLTLSAGWGASRSVLSASGNDQRGRFVVAAAGASITANPTVVLAFNRAWTSAPNIVIGTPSGTTAGEYISWTAPSTTSVTVTWIGTPTNGGNYAFEYICMG